MCEENQPTDIGSGLLSSLSQTRLSALISASRLHPLRQACKWRQKSETLNETVRFSLSLWWIGWLLLRLMWTENGMCYHYEGHFVWWQKERDYSERKKLIEFRMYLRHIIWVYLGLARRREQHSVGRPGRCYRQATGRYSPDGRTDRQPGSTPSAIWLAVNDWQLGRWDLPLSPPLKQLPLPTS